MSMTDQELEDFLAVLRSFGWEVVLRNEDELELGEDICELKVDSEWRSLLPEDDWQDRIAYSPDNRFVGLVRWDIIDNAPGFRIVIIDTETKLRIDSARIAGCCDFVS